MSIYFDHNATTKPSDQVRNALSEWIHAWGNPSSIHQPGRLAKGLLDQARRRVAQSIGAHPIEVIFTSGGSEANNMALKGLFQKGSGGRLLISSVEHPSLSSSLDFLHKLGVESRIIPVDRKGVVDLETYDRLLNEKTSAPITLVSVMFANNETGNIFPIKKMTRMAHKVGALFHTDAVQGLGKVPLDVKHLGVDLASFSGHKFYALKGAGALYCRRGISLEPLIHGGGQERSRRGGTENLLSIASLGLMCEMMGDLLSKGAEIESLRNHMQHRILQENAGVSVTGGESRRVPGTLNLVISRVSGETLLMNLDLQGFAVSTGAACSSGRTQPSAALMAMGLSAREAQSSLRISLGLGNTLEEVDLFCDVFKKTVERLRSLSEFDRDTKVFEEGVLHVP